MDSKNNIENYLDDEFILVNSGFSLKGKKNYKKALNHLDTKYFSNDNINKEDLEEDIIMLKSYRDYLEKYDIGMDTIIDLIIVYISFQLGLLSPNIKEHICELLFSLILFLIICVYCVFKTSKWSSTSKAREINKLIYKLENIEKNICDNVSFLEEKHVDFYSQNYEVKIVKSKKEEFKNEDEIITSDENSKDIEHSHFNYKNGIYSYLTIAKDRGKNTLSTSKRYYNFSYSSEALIESTDIDVLVKYVEINYLSNDDISKNKLINDLNLFKTMQYAIELDISNNEKFSSNLKILKFINSDTIRVDKWSSSNRLKTIKNIILVLETIKEEIDRKSNNFKNQVHKGRGKIKKWKLTTKQR